VPNADSSPALLRAELRAALRRHRTDQGMVGEDVSRAIRESFEGSFSAAKLSRIESGQQLPSPRDVSDLAHIYKVARKERDRLVQLSKDAKKPGWWQDFAVPDGDYRTLIDYESAAVAMRNYESTFVPGLLQTPEYAKDVIDALALEYDEGERADLVKVRLRRQDRLTGTNPLRLHVVMQENALLRSVSDRQVMLDQIDHLQAMALRPNVTIRIIRYNSGLYVGLQASSFAMLEFADPATTPKVCYVEGILDSMFAQESQLEKIENAWSQMVATVATPEGDTAELLSRIRAQVAEERD
jgi:Domain of unknown function (DUF5753)/Helix-turn-helix domain